MVARARADVQVEKHDARVGTFSRWEAKSFAWAKLRARQVKPHVTACSQTQLSVLCDFSVVLGQRWPRFRYLMWQDQAAFHKRIGSLVELVD